ncbi:glycosyltransferase family 25 protein [Chelativorans sp. M5D2P16]|uniref:glycosyltransferase family 25 protein n=1 Tax=Chelativorans sp. M5D2P16 TaxID=3095678 RepID=UPI002AC9F9EC|nr:glycosyltransferase family 25 protein [Chelativorans sp. M5D2P16]MDZ5696396.1 glycosyltransferase family 25 protein [Chelativorans sp. M5D2P16]
MTIPVLAINLDRSKDRWEELVKRAALVNVAPERIPAVDGNAIDPAEWHEFDARGFRLRHGRHPLAAEYGCYLSHIRALDWVIEAGASHAVIVEDDADFKTDFLPRLEALTRLSPAPDVIKLYNHRLSGFLPKATSAAGDVVGRCIHGPLGSAMGYLVTRQGAVKLRRALLPISLPYDIALERGWSHGASIVTTRKPLLKRVKSASTISPAGYKPTKFPFYMRIPTALFRGQDYLRRAAYAARG